MTKLQSPLHTSTGELFQLVRVYYQIFNQGTVLGVFKKLRCIDFEARSPGLGRAARPNTSGRGRRNADAFL